MVTCCIFITLPIITSMRFQAFITASLCIDTRHVSGSNTFIFCVFQFSDQAMTTAETPQETQLDGADMDSTTKEDGIDFHLLALHALLREVPAA